MSIGIDKIGLWTNDYTITNVRDQSIFGHDRTTKQGGKPLPVFRGVDGSEIDANGIFHNCSILNLDINTKGLLVAFNPSIHSHPYNLLSTLDQGLHDHVGLVDRKLKSLGIGVNLHNMMLCRIDVARNTLLNNPYSNYSQSFQLLRCKRQTKKIEYPDGYTLGNKSHEFGFYDKGKKAKLDNPLIDVPNNLLRGEMRALNSESVKRHTKLDSLQSLLETPPEDIEAAFKTYLNNIVFSNTKTNKQAIIQFSDEIDLFNQLKEQHPKGYFTKWLNVLSLDYLLSKFGSLEVFDQFLIHCGEIPRTKNRHMNSIKELIELRGNLTPVKQSVSPTDLLKEIKDKLAA